MSDKVTKFDKNDVLFFMTMFKISRRDLADMMGVTEAQVANWISGHRNVPETTKRIFLLFSRRPELMGEFG